MRIETPFEALDAHLAQWEWTGTGPSLLAATRFMEVYRDGKLNAPVPIPPEMDGQALINTVEIMLNQGRTFYITDEIVQVINEAASSMPPAPLRMQDIITPEGFLLFPEPIPYFDTEIGVQAIGWSIGSVGDRVTGEMKPGVQLFLYSPTIELHDIFDAPWNRQELGAPPPFTLMDYLAWGSGTDWYIEPDYDRDKAISDPAYQARATAEHVGNIRKFLLALWAFMDQKIVPVERVRPPRPLLRRWGRSGVEVPEDGCVTTVHYRTYIKVEGEEHDPDAEAPYWSHRWLVSGHWRSIDDKENPGSKRLVWVRPHIKGPEDRPLVIKERLGVINR